MTQTEALRLALEALRKAMQGNLVFDEAMEAFKAIEAVLEAKDEPVAWLHRFIEGGISIGLKPLDLERHPERWEPLYITPPQRTWISLTDEEKNKMAFIAGSDKHWLIRLVENKLKEHNT